MSVALPDFLTHYARGRPFLSVTSAGPAAWAAVVAQLDDANVWGRARFADPHYLPRRHRVEAELRAELLGRGGRPVLDHPIYCHLGRSAVWERDQRPGMCGRLLPLARLPLAAISFTVGDSLVCRDPSYRQEAAALGRGDMLRSGEMVFFDELAALVCGPDPAVRLADLEAQLWVLPTPDVVTVVEI